MDNKKQEEKLISKDIEKELISEDINKSEEVTVDVPMETIVLNSIPHRQGIDELGSRKTNS